MAKQAIADAKRLNAFGVDPDHLCVVGIDTKHKEGEHPLWDERIHRKLHEPFIANLMAVGVLEPILVRKNGETLEVIDGRQRVLSARVPVAPLTRRGHVFLDLLQEVARFDVHGVTPCFA